MRSQAPTFLILSLVCFSACSSVGQQGTQKGGTAPQFSGARGEVKLMILDPGHFHAGLVQKTMYAAIDSTVYVYAPKGPDLHGYLDQVEAYNKRADSPTHWGEKIYTGDDFLQKMLTEKPGNMLVVSGNNVHKTQYIKAAVDSGINVFADKPMAINSGDFALLEKAFQSAREHGVLLYDMMTERYEITTIVQRELSKIPDVFGELQQGTMDNPAITKESVHHFFKDVSGKPIKRPAWFFDTEQQGEGTVDITTHLVDLVQWEAFPDQPLQKSDVEMLEAKRWPTGLTLAQFRKVTRLDTVPGFLQKDLVDGKLNVYCNGEMIYKLKGKYAKISVTWNFEAPQGTGDTHYSIMRGTRCDVFIQQGETENFRPTVYIRGHSNGGAEAFERKLKKAVEQDIAAIYPGLKLVKLAQNLWTVAIPNKYKIGHEAHFGQVTEKYLRYLRAGKLPDWEVPDMITKYYTTTQAYELSKKP